MAPSGSVLTSPDATAQCMVFAKRWSGFVVAIWLMALSGTYGFSNYSTALKEVLGLNQEQLNRLSVAKDLGDSCGIIAGVLCNYLPGRTLLVIGACVGFVGNGIQWLVISGLISAPPFWIMFLISMLAGNTVSWMNASVFTLSVRNFPRNRGPVAGLFKGYMGLSAAIYSSFCDNFFSSSSSKYVFMLMTVPPIFCLLTAVFFQPVPPSETPEDIKAEQRSLFVFTTISVALAVLLVLQNLVPGVKQGTARPVFMSLLFVILAAPAFVPIALFLKMKRDLSVVISPMNDKEEATEDESNSKDGNMVQTDGEHADASIVDPTDNSRVHTRGEHVDASFVDMEKDGLRRPLLGLDKVDSVGEKPSALKLGDDWGTFSLFKTWHVYVLYLTLFCGAGTGMTFSNNLGQVGQSFGYSTVTLFTSLFSLGNFFGRIMSGIASEYFLKARSTPRPLWIGVGKVPMIALFAWLSMGSTASLYAGSIFLGFSHGTVISLTIPTISEFYGLKYFGTNYMVINTHILAGSTIFSGIIAGYLYDMHATSQESSGTLTCYGASCYGTTFRVFAGVLIFALFFDGVLTFYSKPLYRQLKEINTYVDKEGAQKQISYKI